MSGSYNDTPVAISTALRQLVRRMDVNNSVLKEVNNDLILSLKSLEANIVHTFQSISNEGQIRSKKQITDFNRIGRSIAKSNPSLTAGIEKISVDYTPEKLLERSQYRADILKYTKLSSELLAEISGKLKFANEEGIAKIFEGYEGLKGLKAVAPAGAAIGAGEVAAGGLEAETGLKDVAKLSIFKRLLGGAGTALGVAGKGILGLGGAIGLLETLNSTHAVKAGTPLFSMDHMASSPLTKILEGGASGAAMGGMFGPEGAIAGGIIGAGADAFKMYGHLLDIKKIEKYLTNPKLGNEIKSHIIKWGNDLGDLIIKGTQWIGQEVLKLPAQIKELFNSKGMLLLESLGSATGKALTSVVNGLSEGIGHILRELGEESYQQVKNLIMFLKKPGSINEIETKLENIGSDIYKYIYGIVPTWKVLENDLKKFVVGGIPPNLKNAFNKYSIEVGDWLANQIPTWSSVEKAINKEEKKGEDIASEIGTRIHNIITGFLDTLEKAANPANWFKSKKSDIHKSAFDIYNNNAFGGSNGSQSLAPGISLAAYRTPYTPSCQPPSDSDFNNKNAALSMPHLSNNLNSDFKLYGNATGVAPSTLRGITGIESSFNYKANNGDAHGLFQFKPGTWRDLVKKYGQQYGITNSKADKDSLRNQMILGSLMTRDNNKYLAEHLKTNKLTATDSLLANFLGANGAFEFLSDMKNNPNSNAASLFPIAAADNESIFYKNGQAQTLQQIYDHFDKRLQHFSKLEQTPKKSMTHRMNREHNPPNHIMQTPMRSNQNQQPQVIQAGYKDNQMPDMHGIPIHVFDNGLIVTNTYSA
jgi:hypothetical protein